MSWFGRWVPLVKQSEDKPDFTLLEKRIAELIAGDAEAAQHADALKAEVAKLAAMRAACVVPRQLDEESLDKLKAYFRLLRMLHKRVPSSKIVFKWRCTITPRGGGVFSSDPSVSKGGLGLEMRAVAYQMAVCCAAIGARTSESEELPKASKWFKNAYFLLNYARDSIEVDLHKDSELNKDLKPDALLALSRVMLAQAANIWHRVMSDHIVSKRDASASALKRDYEKQVHTVQMPLPSFAPRCLSIVTDTCAVVRGGACGQHNVRERTFLQCIIVTFE
jgi:hypothetical protein